MSVRFTVYDAEDNVVEDLVVEGTHEDGHAEGRCDMWCQLCYVEGCGAPEQPKRRAAR